MFQKLLSRLTSPKPKTWLDEVAVKSGVKLHTLKPEILEAVKVALKAYTLFGYKLTVTSTNDGKHMRGSRHYVDQAFDSRIWGIKLDTQKCIVDYAKSKLGKDYDIVIEKDHLHWEYDPK
jgi:hypothetical protein